MRNFDFILKVVKTMQELGEQVRRLDLCGEDAQVTAWTMERDGKKGSRGAH